MAQYPGDELSPNQRRLLRLVRTANAAWSGPMGQRGVRFLYVELDEPLWDPFGETGVIFDALIDSYVSEAELLEWLPEDCRKGVL